jgi:hypothetical protein
MSARKVIITCAVTGSVSAATTRSRVELPPGLLLLSGRSPDFPQGWLGRMTHLTFG